MAAPDDAKEVLSALRLGWFLAEVRGRNKPGGQPGASTHMPDQDDHALPLRIERTETERRIEAQKVVAQLAADLHVDADDGSSFASDIDAKAKLLNSVCAPKVSNALRRALDQLRMAAAGQPYPGQSRPPAPHLALQTLQAAVKPQSDAVASCDQALATAMQDPAAVAEGERNTAAARVSHMQAAADGARYGLGVLHDAISALEEVSDTDAAAARARVKIVGDHLQDIVHAARQPWEDLARLLWKFDAYIQDQLRAVSETQACGYQLGRGLAETYWALDPSHTAGSQSWGFLLGEARCDELGRLAGRLGAYMSDYTAPAISGSIEIWRQVASQRAWRRDDQVANDALYRQTRRWYELIVVGQDPTTLIKPGRHLSSYRIVGRAVRLFWLQLVATMIGLIFLVALILLSVGTTGITWEQAVSGILAAGGLSLAGLTGTLKNSAQAILKRLRQDTYTDLVAIAMQTAPPPPDKSYLYKALSNRRLTQGTPN